MLLTTGFAKASNCCSRAPLIQNGGFFQWAVHCESKVLLRDDDMHVLSHEAIGTVTIPSRYCSFCVLEATTDCAAVTSNRVFYHFFRHDTSRFDSVGRYDVDFRRCSFNFRNATNCSFQTTQMYLMVSAGLIFQLILIVYYSL